MDEILKNLSIQQRESWERIRKITLAVAPRAEIGVVYNLPGFRFNGRGLVAFGVAKNHYSLFPMSGTIVERLASELENFETSKGTIRFTAKRNIPAALLKKILRARLAEIEANGGKPKRASHKVVPAPPTVRRKTGPATSSR